MEIAVRWMDTHCARRHRWVVCAEFCRFAFEWMRQKCRAVVEVETASHATAWWLDSGTGVVRQMVFPP